MISIVDLILESAPKPKFEYGCAMLYFNFPEMNKIQDVINPDDLYQAPEGDPREYGLESSPHCTLLFGLHKEVTLDQVKDALSGITFSECKLYNASMFDNPKYDVLKFDVGYPTRGGAFLSKANEALKKYPYTSDFPDYHPHATIAYLNKGTAAKYIKELKGIEYTLTPTHAVYSVPSGEQHKIKINIK